LQLGFTGAGGCFQEKFWGFCCAIFFYSPPYLKQQHIVQILLLCLGFGFCW
jgi:hypothetical protein